MAPTSTDSFRSKAEELDFEETQKDSLTHTDEDFGGTDARLKLERKLLMKLDLRMSILVVIYILNYVRFLALLRSSTSNSHLACHRLIAIMHRKRGLVCGCV